MTEATAAVMGEVNWVAIGTWASVLTGAFSTGYNMMPIPSDPARTLFPTVAEGGVVEGSMEWETRGKETRIHSFSAWIPRGGIFGANSGRTMRVEFAPGAHHVVASVENTETLQHYLGINFKKFANANMSHARIKIIFPLRSINAESDATIYLDMPVRLPVRAAGEGWAALAARMVPFLAKCGCLRLHYDYTMSILANIPREDAMALSKSLGYSQGYWFLDRSGLEQLHHCLGVPQPREIREIRKVFLLTHSNTLQTAINIADLHNLETTAFVMRDWEVGSFSADINVSEELAQCMQNAVKKRGEQPFDTNVRMPLYLFVNDQQEEVMDFVCRLFMARLGGPFWDAVSEGFKDRVRVCGTIARKDTNLRNEKRSVNEAQKLATQARALLSAPEVATEFCTIDPDYTLLKTRERQHRLIPLWSKGSLEDQDYQFLESMRKEDGTYPPIRKLVTYNGCGVVYHIVYTAGEWGGTV